MRYRMTWSWQRGYNAACCHNPTWIATAGQIRYHYEPAGIVSGDYCDVIDAGDHGGFYFMVGDVSGKGVAASMLTAHLHAMFRSLVPINLSLSCMVQRASRVFSESTLPSHYATLVCGRAFPDGRVELVNAGHPAPLLLTGGNAAPMETSDLPVGMFAAEQFAVTELSLNPGDGIVVYSDGISEATDLGGDEYGIERIRNLVNGHKGATASHLLADAVTTSAGLPTEQRGPTTPRCLYSAEPPDRVSVRAIIPVFVLVDEPQQRLGFDPNFHKRRIAMVEGCNQHTHFFAAGPCVNIGRFSRSRADTHHRFPAGSDSAVGDANELCRIDVRMFEDGQVQLTSPGRMARCHHKLGQPEERNMQRLHAGLARELAHHPIELTGPEGRGQ